MLLGGSALNLLPGADAGDCCAISLAFAVCHGLIILIVLDLVAVKFVPASGSCEDGAAGGTAVVTNLGPGAGVKCHSAGFVFIHCFLR